MNYEKEIQDAGATTAPRVTQEHIDAAILSEDYHVFEGTTLTVCVLTLQNGYTVVGEAACADPANFRVDLGRKFAREDAKKKIWSLLGYALRDRLHNRV